MTFGEVVSTILNYSGQSSGGDFEGFVKTLVNGVYRQVLERGMVPHEQREFSLTTVADTSKYGLPLYVRRVLNIEDPTTPRFVYETTARAFDKSHPGTTTTGTPSYSYPLGMKGIQVEPASDGTVSAVSTSTTDTGSDYKVRVTGFDTDGILITEEITLNGTTAVASGSSYSSSLGIERVTKEIPTGSAFAGNVTIKDSDANTISIIPVWWDSPDYVWIEFYPIPDAAITYVIRAEMRKPPLVNDNDWPEISADYHLLLVYGVTQDLLPTLGKGPTGDRHRSTFKNMLTEFTDSNSRRPNMMWRFQDVQSGAGARQRPYRPLIEGVDYV